MSDKKASVLGADNTLRGAFDDNAQAFRMIGVNTLIPSEYDEMELSYTGDDLTTIVYKMNTAVIATLTLSYTSGKLTSIVKS